MKLALRLTDLFIKQINATWRPSKIFKFIVHFGKRKFYILAIFTVFFFFVRKV
jgi:hypothetical protein